MVWALTHFHSYLYGQEVTVFTDHSAVKSILNAPSPSGKHAHWWTKVYGSGIRDLKILHRSGKSNLCADALSHSPVGSAPEEGLGEAELQVAVVSSSFAQCDLPALLNTEQLAEGSLIPYQEEQLKDPSLASLILYLEDGRLPDHDEEA